MELYQSLHENTKNITTYLDDIKKGYIVNTIPRLDQKGHELLFFIIRYYHAQQTKEVNFALPYHSESTNPDNVKFDLDEFPPQLQHMIHMFVRMHYEYINYEEERKKD
jgi:hypothetical protein